MQTDSDYPCMTKEDDELNFNETKREPIFRKALLPFLIFLRIFGLIYDFTKNCPLSKRTRLVVKFYCYFLVLVRFTWCGLSSSGLFRHSGDSDIFHSLIYVAFYFKCFAQSVACLQLSPISCSCRLWDFIEHLEEFLSDIKLKNCHILETKFKKRLRVWLYVFVVICVGNVILQGIMLTNHTVVSSEHFFNMTRTVLQPLPMNNGVIALTLIVNTFCFGAWFLPAALCGVLSQCISYTYDELYRYIEHVSCKNITRNAPSVCLKTHIRYVRQKYVKLGRMVNTLDDMVKYIYLLSFLLDVVLICVILRVVIYTFTELVPRIFFCAWIIPPLFTLIALSHYSSQIVEKAERMHDFVQNFNADHIDNDVQAEMQLLMFQLSSQPAVMTIFGMIPLYKSIIISIFVSIVTYFALMISF